MAPQDYDYLLIPGMTVSGFNAMGNPYVIGAPGPTAIIGWGHALERELRGLNREGAAAHPVRVAGTALAVQECDLDEGRPLFPAQMHGFKKEEEAAEEGGLPPMVEEVKGHGRFALAVALDFGEAEEEEAEDALGVLKDGLAADLLSRHGFAGGAVHDMAESQLFDGFEPFQQAFRQLHGAALIDRADLLEPAEDGAGEEETDTLDRLLDAIALEHRVAGDGAGERTVERRRRQPGWVVPYPAGFKAIESPKDRAAAVNGHPHAYAEPLLGVGEYVPTARLAAGDGERILSAFWRPTAENGVYAARPLADATA
jgi:CRISPR-associated protein Csy2